MYELGLALEYLHERDVAFGRLNRDCIFLGTDGKVKLVGFGSASSDWKVTRASIDAWRPDDWVPSFANDVYSLGKCILDALTECERTDYGLRVGYGGFSVEDPAAILEKRMCCPDPRSRWKMPIVTQFLAALASLKAQQSSNQDEVSEPTMTVAPSNNMKKEMEDHARALVAELKGYEGWGYPADKVKELMMKRITQTWHALVSISGEDPESIFNELSRLLIQYDVDSSELAMVDTGNDMKWKLEHVRSIVRELETNASVTLQTFTMQRLDQTLKAFSIGDIPQAAQLQ
ncbi:TPA: hypothetical protein N0F65_011482 [Lagenidium giganteum]|uniref:Protein kinase domain-containing protein n=1 Tax=Lagenidium giganteum TaxID=4803 RepID=A0AAV2Z873_9STRA|nr:TPA: hypothetical protein N0F65_011482 [Lagenidium giganteum]